MLKWLLGTPPKIGSEWKASGDTNPFSKKIYTVVSVLDGWVRIKDWNGFYEEYPIRTLRFDFREIV